MEIGECAARLRALWDELGRLEDARDRLWGYLAGGHEPEIEAAIGRVSDEIGAAYDEYRLALLDYEAAADAAGAIWRAGYETEA